MLTKEEIVFFSTFYQENFEMLSAYAYRFVSNWEDAHDLTQDAFMTAIVKFEDFSKNNPTGWMKITIRNKAANFNQTKKIHSNYSQPLNNHIPKTAPNEFYDDSAIAHCAELLQPEEFSMIQETIIANEAYSEAYQKFGLSYGAFRKRIYRILKKLRDNWDT